MAGIVERFRHNTRARITAAPVGLLAAALILTSAALLIALYTATEREQDAALIDQAKAVANDFLDGDNQVVSSDLPHETREGVPVDTVVLSPAGGALAESDKQPLGGRELDAIAVQARAESIYWGYVTDRNGIPRRVHAVRLDDLGTVVVISQSETEERRTVLVAGLLMGGVSIVLLVVVGWLAHWLVGRALQPVHEIASLARSISEHDLHRRLDVRARDQLGELAITFNQMLARLEGSFEGMRRFTADASHELRSPLAVMRAELERALGRTRSTEDYREVLLWVLSDVEHMARLIDQLLVLTRAEAGTLRLIRQPVDVVDLLYDTAAHWGGSAEANGVSIEVTAPRSGFVLADQILLRRALDSILENAIRHTSPSSVVQIRAVLDDSGLDIEVSDAGPGIPAELRSRLFAGFARLESARARGRGGSGLSVATSAAIARAHGGRLDLVDRGAGTTLRLHVPRGTSDDVHSPG